MTPQEHAAAVEVLEAEIAELRRGLKSIALNTCCDKCQEAACVARAALGQADCLSGKSASTTISIGQPLTGLPANAREMNDSVKIAKPDVLQ